MTTHAVTIYVFFATKSPKVLNVHITMHGVQMMITVLEKGDD